MVEFITVIYVHVLCITFLLFLYYSYMYTYVHVFTYYISVIPVLQLSVHLQHARQYQEVGG